MSVITTKPELVEKMIPEVLFTVTTSGITISSARLNTSRFVEFDLIGKCRSCKGENIDIDFVITPRNVTLYCNRIKSEKVVLFDTKGKSFHVIHNEQPPPDTNIMTENEKLLLDEFLEMQPPAKKARNDHEESKRNEETNKDAENKETKITENDVDVQKKNNEGKLFEGDELGIDTFLHSIP
uniref:NPL domain-containing protein n=1 Tax=Meloidogyne hapla TaxID=6305 RepID=A0A1I8BWZ4_MELHA